MDLSWWATLYARVGAPYPVLSLCLISLFGAGFFGGTWWLLGESYKSEKARYEAERQREEPDLQLLAPNRETSSPRINGELWATIFHIVSDFTVMNSGGKSITIISVTGRLSMNSTPSDPPGSGLYPFDGDFGKAVTFPSEILPLKLDSGEAQNVPITCRFEASEKPFEKPWYSGVLELELTTTAGKLTRTAEFHVRGISLTRQLRRQPGT